MSSHINSIPMLAKMWKTFQSKAYRDAYVSADIADTITAQMIALRKKHGWSQKELAERANMKQSRISAIEDPEYENISIATLKRLASVFDVALTVRFIPFSELAHWVHHLSPVKLALKCFHVDSLTAAPALATETTQVTRDEKALCAGVNLVSSHTVNTVVPHEISAR
jgi:transcriptional regulator with XRE-family HTH domain